MSTGRDGTYTFFSTGWDGAYYFSRRDGTVYNFFYDGKGRYNTWYIFFDGTGRHIFVSMT